MFQDYVAQSEAELGYREAGDPSALEHQIHRRYPLATVHVQTALAAMDQQIVWYVFRDGALDVGG